MDNKESPQAVPSETYTTEAAESKKKAEADARAPAPDNAKEIFKKLLEQAEAEAEERKGLRNESTK